LSGLARSFAHMFVARVSVGVGEATLSPCAMSLIADSFPPDRRGKPIALYSSAISVGAALAALLGAAVLTWAGTAESLARPFSSPPRRDSCWPRFSFCCVNPHASVHPRSANPGTSATC
ncbi:MAG: MFS transporter, partial [Rhodospirillaceae bacterium]|nr:MFS transporter [Rhodospirillaceae bacterium]